MSKKTNENKENETENIKAESKTENKTEQKVESKTENKIEQKSEKENSKDKKTKVEKKAEEEKKSVAREIMEWIVCIVIAFSLALFIKFFIFTPTLVMQESMTPTVLNGERVLINRLFRTFKWDLKRGDIITFEAPSNLEMANGNLTATYYDKEDPLDSFFYNVMEIGKISYIKRVVGLPGERVEIRDGKVYINGELLEEKYLVPTQRTDIPEGGVPSDFVVPEGYVFAMGDNRTGSSDCRAFGCVPIEKVEGRVSIRIWPLNKLGGIDK